MNKPAIQSPYLHQTINDQKIIDFERSPLDSMQFIVSRITEDGKETIGHVYVEYDGDEFKYISTNGMGKQIFPATGDFIIVERNFERYARFLELQNVRGKNILSKIIDQNKNQKINKTMETKSKNTAQKNRNLNPMRILEYPTPTKEGHIISFIDGYHNVLGRIHKNYNEELKQFEFTAYDHNGKIISKSSKLWELKNQFIKNQDVLLEQAHQRRIASKEKAIENSNEKSKNAGVDKSAERKNEVEKLAEGKSGLEKQHVKEAGRSNNNIAGDQQPFEERSQELDDLRNNKGDDREDIGLER